MNRPAQTPRQAELHAQVLARLAKKGMICNRPDDEWYPGVGPYPGCLCYTCNPDYTAYRTNKGA